MSRRAFASQPLGSHLLRRIERGANAVEPELQLLLLALLRDERRLCTAREALRERFGDVGRRVAGLVERSARIGDRLQRGARDDASRCDRRRADEGGQRYSPPTVLMNSLTILSSASRCFIATVRNVLVSRICSDFSS